MKVLWTSAALRDRLAIWDYIAAENPQAAEGMYQLFRLAPEQLKDNPLPVVQVLWMVLGSYSHTRIIGWFMRFMGTRYGYWL